MQDNRFIEFSGVRVSQNEIGILDKGRVSVSVLRDNIKEISLKNGFFSKHPIIQALFGCGLISLGYYPLKFLVFWLQNGGTIMDATILLILSIPLGLWVIYDSSKRGYYLEVKERFGRKKFPFVNSPSLSDINSFIEKFSSMFQYKIIS